VGFECTFVGRAGRDSRAHCVDRRGGTYRIAGQEVTVVGAEKPVCVTQPTTDALREPAGYRQPAEHVDSLVYYLVCSVYEYHYQGEREHPGSVCEAGGFHRTSDDPAVG
jgi:hypothetical protein